MKFLLFFCLLAASLALETCKPWEPASTTWGPSEVTYSFNETFKVVELPASTGARCLDGSNYKFLFAQGSGSGAKKFMISFEGGGFCGFDGYGFFQSCYLRSKTGLGSSSVLPANGSVYYSTDTLGFVSNLKEYNPDFYNWNKIILHYCDGSNHQGHLDQPVNINGTKLYFRGYDNVKSTLDYLKSHNSLFSAAEIIISGGSAGGQTTYIWANYLSTFFPSQIRLMAIPDAGMFLDMYNPHTECNLFRYYNQIVANATNSKKLDLYKPCKYYGTDDVWKCMIAENIVENIKANMFIINSQQDSESMRTQFGVTCSTQPSTCNSTEKARIATYRAKILSIANNLIKKKPKWGFYLRTCFEHVYEGTWAWYGYTKNVYNPELKRWDNLRQAIHRWYSGLSARYIDQQDWEHNPFCTYK